MTVPANVTRFLFELIGENESLRVVEFAVKEGISRPFLLELVVAAENDNIDLAGWIGKAGVLTLFHTRHPRVFHGELVSAEQLESGRRFTRYRLILAPKFHLLSYRSSCRIFQSLSVPQIIEQLFDEARIEGNDYRLDLRRSYPVRDYCVQYQESEFHFLSRLMEEEGIFYFFEHRLDRHVMVISDANSVFGPVAHLDQLNYHPKGSMRPDHETIYQFESYFRVASGQVTLSDYNFEKPNLTLRQDASYRQKQNLEVYQYPGRFLEPGEGERYATLNLESHQAGVERYPGVSDSQWLAAGYLFQLNEHQRQEYNQEYLLVTASHQGKQPQSLEEGATNEGSSYHCEFEAMPAKVAFRPPMTHKKQCVDGVQTAFVTGPAGEEIYTDQYGRIKVQFHWDREGQYNENASCWVRVSQGWTGKEWGAMALPRVGQEVIVHFLDGDPDRPIVTGSLYHSVNKTPYELPGQKTRTTFKSQSYPGGGGYNELRIDDKKGSEQIYVHAEKDVDIYVKNDQKELADANRHLTVEKSRFLETKGDEHLTVGKNWNQKVGKTLSQTIGKDHQLKVSGSMMAQAGREMHLKAGTQLVIQSGTQLTLKGGAGLVALDPSGVTIQGPMVRINSGGSAGSATSASPTAPQKPTTPETGEAGKTVKPKTAEAAHQADKVGFESGTAGEAMLDEAPIAATTSSVIKPDREISSPLELEELTVSCTDADGSGAAGMHYLVKLPDGSSRGGKLDKTGTALIKNLPPGAVEVELGEAPDEREIKQTREKIQKALNSIVAEEEQEAARIEAELSQKGFFGQALEYEMAKARGGAKAIWGIITGLKELSDLGNPQVHLTNALKSAWAAYKYSDEQPFLDSFTQNMTDAQFAELADVIGFDPRTITKEQLAEAQALANFVWDDAETRDILVSFAKDYIGAQHSLELAESGAGMATEVALDVLITALTLGAGATIVVASKLRHLNKFKQIGLLIKKLAKAIKKKASFKRKSGQTGGRVDAEQRKPDNQPISIDFESLAKERAIMLERLDGGHSIDRHGPEVSNALLMRRIETGIAPDEKFSPTPASTRFKSYQDWEETRAKALETISRRNSVDLSKPPGPDDPKRYTEVVDHGKAIDDGFVGDKSSAVKVVDVGSKKVAKVYPEHQFVEGITRTTTTVAWSDNTQRWSVVQHFPNAKNWNQTTQTYD